MDKSFSLKTLSTCAIFNLNSKYLKNILFQKKNIIWLIHLNNFILYGIYRVQNWIKKKIQIMMSQNSNDKHLYILIYHFFNTFIRCHTLTRHKNCVYMTQIVIWQHDIAWWLDFRLFMLYILEDYIFFFYFIIGVYIFFFLIYIFFLFFY